MSRQAPSDGAAITSSFSRSEASSICPDDRLAAENDLDIAQGEQRGGYLARSDGGFGLIIG